MTTRTESSSTETQQVANAAHGLADIIAARATEIENARRLPTDLLDRLVAAGCFRLLLPASHGGVGADLPSAMHIFEGLARADPSTGWTVVIGNGAWVDAALLPRATFDALYADGPDAILAGAFNPTGTATAVAGGYRVTGRWAFASGCQHAAWLWGNCIEDVGRADGAPAMRLALFDPEEVTIEDSWYVSGLRGTGSHHFHADDVFVPTERTGPMDGTPCLDAPIVRIPAPALFAFDIAAVALGTAQGALDDMLAMADRKVPLLDTEPLAANPLFHVRLAEADTTLRAARALLYQNAQRAWDTASNDLAFVPRRRAQLRAAATWATARAAEVVDAAYQAGGGGALYSHNSLQRRLRDMRAITQHFVVKPDSMRTVGAIMAGQEVDLTVF